MIRTLPTGARSAAPRRFLLGLIVMLGLMLVVWVLSMVLVYFRTGAEWDNLPSTGDAAGLLRTAPKLTWRSTSPVHGDTPDPYLQAQIGDEYRKAWQALALATRTGDFKYAKDHFAESYWPRLRADLRHGERWRTERIDLGHHLELHTFSLDKQTVAFRDRAVRSRYRHTDRETGALLFTQEDIADYEVVMTLDDDVWRVRHWRRLPATVVAAISVDTVPQSVRIEAGQFLIDGNPFRSRGINYYPRHAPWFDFWNTFSADTVRQDLQLTRELGFNTVRIFVFYEQFGGAELLPAYRDRLRTFLDLAAAADLRVVVTLFDFLPTYALSEYAATERHLRQLLTALRDHPALLAWDLKNEADLDFAVHGRTRVIEWLAYTAERARVYDPDHPVTVGWSSAAHAPLLADHLDFPSFHFYEHPDSLAQRLTQLTAQFPQRPLFVSELGQSTFDAAWYPWGRDETAQQAYYQHTLTTLSRYPTVSFAAWTLHDFPVLPAGVFSGPFWEKRVQQRYGLVREDGSWKPAAQVLRGE